MFKIQKEVTVEMKIVYQNLQTLKLQYQHIELQILSDIQSEDNLIISSFPKLFRRFCDFSCMYSIRIERHSLHSRYQLVDTYSHILQVPKQQTSCVVNRSSLFNWFLLQKCLKINRMTLFSSKSFLLIYAGPQKPQKLTASKMKDESFGQKILISCRKMDNLVP